MYYEILVKHALPIENRLIGEEFISDMAMIPSIPVHRSSVRSI